MDELKDNLVTLEGLKELLCPESITYEISSIIGASSGNGLTFFINIDIPIYAKTVQIESPITSLELRYDDDSKLVQVSSIDVIKRRNRVTITFTLKNAVPTKTIMYTTPVSGSGDYFTLHFTY